jgi:hypothetical protein
MNYISHSEDCIWHFALRYALPRQSTASSVVSDFLRENLTRIRPQTLRQMMDEINEAISDGLAGDSCIDVKIWIKLADDIQRELSK